MPLRIVSFSLQFTRFHVQFRGFFKVSKQFICLTQEQLLYYYVFFHAFTTFMQTITSLIILHILFISTAIWDLYVTHVLNKKSMF